MTEDVQNVGGHAERPNVAAAVVADAADDLEEGS
jgi:hypothetical protein